MSYSYGIRKCAKKHLHQFSKLRNIYLMNLTLPLTIRSRYTSLALVSLSLMSSSFIVSLAFSCSNSSSSVIAVCSLSFSCSLYWRHL